MLCQLTVRDFALIEGLTLEFGTGFTVLTGETGAGKSLLVDAIGAALGGRLAADMVRAGAERTIIEAAFDVHGPSGAGVADWAEEGQILLGRELSTSGRSVFRLNGRMCTAATVREVASGLIDLHGQHEHQSLLNSARHAEFLDRWAGGKLLDARQQARTLHRELRETAQSLAALRANEREIAQRADLYRFQKEEIEAADPQPGEDTALEADRVLLANAERLHTASGQALQSLVRGDVAAADLLSAAQAKLEAVASLDPRLEPAAELLQTAVVAADEAARELRSYHDGVEFNPDRLEQVSDRLELLRRLKKKYGDTLEEVLACRDRVAVDLARIDRSDEEEQALVTRRDLLRAQLCDLAMRVRDGRRRAAARFDRQATAHLAELGMERTRFETRVADGEPASEERELASVLGVVEFLLSPNPGEPLRPLARTASGGELSRLMLALKSVMAAASPVPTLIFDEIDSGIGGRTGGVLGHKLAALGAAAQVLCVTHLPQIASLAGTHYHVSKTIAGSRTVVQVQRLQEGARVAELARMLGGSQATATRHAEKLLADACPQQAGVR